MRQPGAQWTDDEIRDVLRRVQARESLSSIGRHYGCPDHHAIRRLLGRKKTRLLAGESKLSDTGTERKDGFPMPADIMPEQQSAVPGPFVWFPDARPAHPSPSQPPDFAALRRVDALQRQLTEERERRKLAERELSDAEERLRVSAVLEAPDLSVLPAVEPSGQRLRTRSRAIPVVLASDWHVEEVVDPATIHGLNAYSPDVARRRIDRFWRGSAWLINHWSLGFEIREAVVAVLGDLINGYIHDELVEGNAMSPTEATEFAQELLVMGLRRLLAECPQLERVVVPCCVGNHARTTGKPRIATATKNSFERLMYRQAAKHMANEPRVEFIVASGKLLYQPVCGQVLRLTHGDQVKYNGGTGGISIPLRKACSAWDTFYHADHTLIGHYHQRRDFGFAVVNGSVPGYTAVAEDFKCEFETPSQQALLLVEGRGKADVAPIWCDEPRAELAA